MADSIIQAHKNRCFLCGGGEGLEPLDCHHVMEGVNRKNSEKYGLKVYLHHNRCHCFGKNSVHGNEGVNKALKAIAQKRAMEYYKWSMEDWLKIFRKNYL